MAAAYERDFVIQDEHYSYCVYYVWRKGRKKNWNSMPTKWIPNIMKTCCWFYRFRLFSFWMNISFFLFLLFLSSFRIGDDVYWECKGKMDFSFFFIIILGAFALYTVLKEVFQITPFFFAESIQFQISIRCALCTFPFPFFLLKYKWYSCQKLSSYFMKKKENIPQPWWQKCVKRNAIHFCTWGEKNILFHEKKKKKTKTNTLLVLQSSFSLSLTRL